MSYSEYDYLQYGIDDMIAKISDYVMGYSRLPYLKHKLSHEDFFTSNKSGHTMRWSLKLYLENKIHHLVHEKEVKEILISGKYFEQRKPYMISKAEKPYKKFNFKRPLAEFDNRTLTIYCFPGRNYTKHIISLYKTYKELMQMNYQVYYKLPDKKDLEVAIDRSNLSEVPKGEVAILGYVEDISVDGCQDFQGDGDFNWASCERNGKIVTRIGCKFCYWGETAGEIVKRLAKKGYKKIFYIAKLGGLKKEYEYNAHLATGGKSWVEGETITWKNAFKKAAEENSFIQTGNHITSPSTIHEDLKFLKKHHKKYSFVDSEIGHMAKAAQENGAEFSYLHLITNNLHFSEKENLSCERSKYIIEKRKTLFKEINRILKSVI